MTHQSSVLLITEDDEAPMAEGLRARLMEVMEVGAHACELRLASSLRAEDSSWIAARDLVFVRSRSPRLLDILARVERTGGLVVNSTRSIRVARQRLGALAMVAAAGVPTARDYQGPIAAIPFARAVIKSRYDRGRSSATLHERPSTSSRVVYAQEHLPGAVEHKLYLVGAETFAFVQRPTLLEPDKLATRRRVPASAQLEDHARRAAIALGLEIAGVDFIEDSAGLPRVTDVNSNQGLHTFSEGHDALARHLVELLARARSRTHVA